MAHVDVRDALPGDGLRVDVEPRKAPLLFLGQLRRLRLVDPQLAQAGQLHGREADAVVALLRQPAEESGVALRPLVVHPRVQRRGE